MEDIKWKRNRKYETTLSGIQFIKDMIAWNKEIDIPRVQDALDVSFRCVQRTIREYNLQGFGYKSHYDKLFGEGAWDKGNKLNGLSQADDLKEKLCSSCINGTWQWQLRIGICLGSLGRYISSTTRIQDQVDKSEQWSSKASRYFAGRYEHIYQIS